MTHSAHKGIVGGRAGQDVIAFLANKDLALRIGCRIRLGIWIRLGIRLLRSQNLKNLVEIPYGTIREGKLLHVAAASR